MTHPGPLVLASHQTLASLSGFRSMFPFNVRKPPVTGVVFPHMALASNLLHTVEESEEATLEEIALRSSGMAGGGLT